VGASLSEVIGVRDGMPGVWDVLGWGLYLPDYLGLGAGADFYRDKKGVRLIALQGAHLACDTIILSSES